MYRRGASLSKRTPSTPISTRDCSWRMRRRGGERDGQAPFLPDDRTGKRGENPAWGLDRAEKYRQKGRKMFPAFFLAGRLLIFTNSLRKIIVLLTRKRKESHEKNSRNPFDLPVGCLWVACPAGYASPDSLRRFRSVARAPDQGVVRDRRAGVVGVHDRPGRYLGRASAVSIVRLRPGLRPT